MVSLFINWDVSPEIFNLGGFSTGITVCCLRWRLFADTR